jgi:purine-binding chemotaxis protein CheW
MTTKNVTRDKSGRIVNDQTETRDFVTMLIADQWFGIPVLGVQEVLGPQVIARVPLAPAEVAGNLNLRGRIATAIEMRKKLGLPARPEGQSEMSIVVDRNGELYSLVIDSVGEVLTVARNDFERNPPTLEPAIRDISLGIYRLEDKLLVVLDVERLLEQDQDSMQSAA